jgi:hypothetical protein
MRSRAIFLAGVLMVAGLLAGVTAGSVTAATSTTVTWKVSSLTAGQVKSLSAVAKTNSPGGKTWSKKGSCTLTPKSKPTTLTMGSTGSCVLMLKIAKSGKYLAKTVTTTITRKIPALRTDLSKATVLGTSTVKLAKVAGISSSGVQPASRRPTEVGDVIFKTTGIVAYAQADSSSQTGSKLLAVSATGATSDAISSGTAVVRDFYSVPNGDVYIVFESKVALTTGGTPCLLAVVDVTTGVPTCVDSTLDSITSSLGQNDNVNPPIQTDASGAIYYAGYSGSSSVLRKAKNGVTTDLINANISLSNFIVQSDGTVLVSGMTTSSSVTWLRRISPSGGLKNLAITYVGFLWEFADGKVYAGAMRDSMYGIKRYSTDLDALEDKYWITGNTNGVTPDGHFTVDLNTAGIPECLWPAYQENLSFCGSYGTQAASVFNVLGQKTFGVARGMYPYQLWQYYPTPEKTNVTAINSVTLAQQVITTIILSGTSSTGSNILSLYDTSSKQETVVMDGSNEVEIYSMSYSQKSNSILFTGLRFSDNKYVVGEVSLG